MDRIEQLRRQVEAEIETLKRERKFSESENDRLSLLYDWIDELTNASTEAARMAFLEGERKSAKAKAKRQALRVVR
jgi:SHS2 domain-containing protein